MYDVWDVIGLSGTGTDSYSVDNLFIPEKFAALRDDPAALREKGPLYSITTYTMFGLGFAAISLGVARATLDAAIDLSRGKASRRPQGDAREQRRSGPDRPHRRQFARGARLSLCDRRRGLARSDAAPGTLTEEHRIGASPGLDLDHPSGGLGGRRRLSHGRRHRRVRANQFERRFRDMHAIAQQIQARDTHYEDVGKAILAGSPAAAGQRPT